MNEIKINVEKKNGEIGFNFEEIKDRLSQEMEVYKAMAFTENSKKEAKSTVAELRKLKKAVNDKKVEVKKSFMQPYVEFEEKVKKLDGLIEEPISFISGQVEEFEKKRMEERRQEIMAIYEEAISDIKDYLPIDRVFNPKWLNVTTTKKSISEEIDVRVISVKNDLQTIRSMNSGVVALQIYKTSLSLTDAIQFINKWEAQKAEIIKQQEEEKKREENRQKEREERERKELEKQVRPEPLDQDLINPEELGSKEPQQVQPASKKEPDSTQANAEKIIYEVKADVFQIAQLEAAMREYGIVFTRL